MKTWVDTNTNLEWLYDLDNLLTWDESLAECPEGYRMATTEELSYYLDHTKMNPSVVEGCPFGWNNTWTSDVYPNSGEFIYWTVNFVTGVVKPFDKSNRRDTLYVKDL